MYICDGGISLSGKSLFNPCALCQYRGIVLEQTSICDILANNTRNSRELTRWSDATSNRPRYHPASDHIIYLDTPDNPNRHHHRSSDKPLPPPLQNTHQAVFPMLHDTSSRHMYALLSSFDKLLSRHTPDWRKESIQRLSATQMPPRQAHVSSKPNTVVAEIREFPRSR